MSEAVLVGAEQHLVAESRRRLFRRLLRDRASLLGLVIIVLFALAALFAPVLARHDPNQTDFLNRFAKPSGTHWLGTDHLGRDEFARIVHGGRLSLGMALSATGGITLLGVGLGLVAGVYGRLVETLIMRLVDMLLSVPTLIQALVVVGLLGQGLRNLIITIIFVQWPRYARLVRGMALKVREQTFVEAGRAAVGAGAGSCSATSCPTSSAPWSSSARSTWAPPCWPSPGSRSSASVSRRRRPSGGPR